MLSFSEYLVCVCVFCLCTPFLSVLCDKDNCCEHITGGVNVYLYGLFSLLAPKCAVCLCVCLCLFVSNIKSEYQVKTTYVSDLSKRKVLLHKTHIKVLLVLKGTKAQHK